MFGDAYCTYVPCLTHMAPCVSQSDRRAVAHVTADCTHCSRIGFVAAYTFYIQSCCHRVTVRNNSTQEEKVLHLTNEQERNESAAHFHDSETGVELEVIDKVSTACKPFDLWLVIHSN